MSWTYQDKYGSFWWRTYLSETMTANSRSTFIWEISQGDKNKNRNRWNISSLNNVVQQWSTENMYNWSLNISRCILNLKYIWLRGRLKSKERLIWRVKYPGKATVYSSVILQQSAVIVVEQQQKCGRDIQSVKLQDLRSVSIQSL